MRYLDTPINYLRNEVFKAVTSAAYDDWTSDQIRNIPHIIIEGDRPTYRDTVAREREIVSERVRLALGLDLWSIDSLNGFSQDFDLPLLKEHKLPSQALRVIPSACEACEEKSYFVTNTCRGCLAHPCISVCPVKATSLQNGHSFIDQKTCIKCGRCYEVPAGATKRPRHLNPLQANFEGLAPTAPTYLQGLGSSRVGHLREQMEKIVTLGAVHTPEELDQAMQQALNYRAYGFGALKGILKHLLVASGQAACIVQPAVTKLAVPDVQVQHRELDYYQNVRWRR